jgi:hypothetical protein
LPKKEIEICFPRYGVSALLVSSFAHTIEPPLEVEIREGVLRIESPGTSLAKGLSEVFLKAAEVTREWLEGQKKVKIDVPASGNDRRTLNKVKASLDLTPDSTFVDVFNKFAATIASSPEAMDDIQREDGEFAPVSHFRPELYGLTRGPLYDGNLSSKSMGYDVERLSVGAFLVRMAGYVLSRVGKVSVHDTSGRRRWLTALVLPLDPNRITYYDFYSKLGELRQIGIPGIAPEEAITMWFALSLPSFLDDVYLCAMTDPAGMSAARIDTLMGMSLKSYRMRARRFLDKTKGKTDILLRGFIEDCIRRHPDPELTPAVKLLFRASQEDTRAAEEVVLRLARTAIADESGVAGKIALRALKGLDPLIAPKKKYRRRKKAGG